MTNNTSKRIIPLIALLVSATFCVILFVINFVRFDDGQYDGWIETTATVTGVEQKSFGNKRVIINFYYNIDGEFYKGSVEQDRDGLESQYDTIRIKYNPDNPAENTVVKSFSLSKEKLKPLIISFAAMVISGIAFIHNIITARRDKKQDEAGEKYILNGQEEDV